MTATLSKTKQYETVTIETISGDARILESLGFVPGTVTRVISKAPFFGPVSVEIRGTRVALRYKDAESILVSRFE